MRKPFIPFSTPRPPLVEDTSTGPVTWKTVLVVILPGAFGWFAMGIIAAEIIGRGNLLPTPPPPLTTGFMCVAGFLMHCWLHDADNHARQSGTSMGLAKRVLLKADHGLIAILFVAAILSIPYLWWGVIKQLAAAAGVSAVSQ